MKDINLKNILLTALLFLGMAASFIADAAPTVECPTIAWILPDKTVNGQPLVRNGGSTVYKENPDGTYTQLIDISNPDVSIVELTGLLQDGAHNLSVTVWILAADGLSRGLESGYSKPLSVVQIGGRIYPGGMPSQPGTLMLQCITV